MESTEEKFSGLEVLFESQELRSWELPTELSRTYGGNIGFEEAATYANFVSTIDGVAALPEKTDSPAVISGHSVADRFVMGLLRALSDAVVIGAGTMRDAVRHLWTPGYIYPDLAEEFDKLRVDLGKTPEPSLIVVTGEGNLPMDHPALRRGAIIVTSTPTSERLTEALPDKCRVVALTDDPRIEPDDLKDFLLAEGLRHVLSEAGPRLFAQLLEAGLVDELFLTSSPILAGRNEFDRNKKSRPGIVSGTEFLPDAKLSADLLSLRRADSYLFLRYRLR
jgi:riboflavin biosynthesis pyrimidine reductase